MFCVFFYMYMKAQKCAVAAEEVKAKLNQGLQTYCTSTHLLACILDLPNSLAGCISRTGISQFAHLAHQAAGRGILPCRTGHRWVIRPRTSMSSGTGGTGGSVAERVLSRQTSDRVASWIGAGLT